MLHEGGLNMDGLPVSQDPALFTAAQLELVGPFHEEGSTHWGSAAFLQSSCRTTESILNEGASTTPCRP